MIPAAIIQRNIQHHRDESRPGTGNGQSPSAGDDPHQFGVASGRRRSVLGEASMNPMSNNASLMDHQNNDPAFGEASFFDDEFAPAVEAEEDEPMGVREIIHGIVSGFTIERPAPNPVTDWASIIVTNFIYIVIGVSVVAFGVETLPEFKDGNLSLDIIEGVCVGIFTLEVIIRCATTPSQKEFWTSPLTWIDILSILPYYVSLAVGGTEGGAAQAVLMIRILRLLRITRVFKLVKNNIGFAAVFESLTSSKEALSLMAFMLLVAVATFSSAIYFAELTDNTFDENQKKWIRPNGEVNPFQSLFHAFWWAIVTITTVGYGDEVPITPYGKAIAALAAVAGVFVISFPTAILGANFADIHSKKIAERDERLRRAKKLGAKTTDENGSSTNLKTETSSTTSPAAASPTRLAVGGGLMPHEAGSFGGVLKNKVMNYFFVIGAPPREFTLYPGGTVLYNPILLLQPSPLDPSVIAAKREEVAPGHARVVTMNVLLSHHDVNASVIEALKAAHVANAESCHISPRPLETLTVNATLPNNVDGCRLMCNTFTKPGGLVPLPFFCESAEAEASLLQHLSAISLSFQVTYEPHVNVDLPLSLYTSASVAKTRRPRGMNDQGAVGSPVSNRLIIPTTPDPFRTEEHSHEPSRASSRAEVNPGHQHRPSSGSSRSDNPNRRASTQQQQASGTSTTSSTTPPDDHPKHQEEEL